MFPLSTGTYTTPSYTVVSPSTADATGTLFRIMPFSGFRNRTFPTAPVPMIAEDPRYLGDAGVHFFVRTRAPDVAARRRVKRSWALEAE